MKKHHLGLLAITSIGLFSYYQYTKPKIIVEIPIVARYEIVEIKPPTHFNVSLKNESGEIFKNIYVSKYCNHWKDVNIGDLIELKTKITKTNIDSKTEIDARKVCPDNK